MNKTALITGITGQDGSYLAELPLAEDYEVHGTVRRSSVFGTERIEHLYKDEHVAGTSLHHYADLSDGNSLSRLVTDIQPDEVYNLGAQSHVAVSFENPPVHGRCRRPRHIAAVGSDQDAGQARPLLPGIVE